MSVPIKAVAKITPGFGKPGEKKYFAAVYSSGEETLETITTKIERMSTVSGTDIRAVLYALQDIMKASFADGKIVRFGDLGSFRLSVKSQPEDSPQEVSPGSVLLTRIIYNPDKKLKNWLGTLSFKKG